MPTKYQKRPLESICKIILHCSATPAKMDVGAKEIRQWHVRGNGWVDIGYHFVIRRDGTVEKGRPLHAVGAHCKGHNADSIGICLVGGTRPDATTPENNFNRVQFESCARLIRELWAKFGYRLPVHGHNEYAAKACPVFSVSEFKQEFLEGNE